MYGNKGIDFTRIVMCKARSRTGDGRDGLNPAELAAQRWGPTSVPARVLRAAVSGGSLLPTGSWGDEMISYGAAAAEFFALVRERSIIGRLAGLRQMPFNVRVLRTASGSGAGWIREGKAIPVSAQSFTAGVLEPRKLASLNVFSAELLRDWTAGSENLVRAEMIGEIVGTVDRSFIDPSNSGVADTEPAAVTSSAPNTAATGDPRADLAALFDLFDGDLAGAYMVMHPRTALAMALYRDSGGAYPFPDLGPRGGSCLGLPVLTSRHVPSDSSGAVVAILDPAGIAYGEDPLPEIVTSTEATIEMNSQPAGDIDAPDTEVTRVSLFQAEAVAVKTVQRANFERVRPGSVAYLTGADYAAGS